MPTAFLPGPKVPSPPAFARWRPVGIIRRVAGGGRARWVAALALGLLVGACGGGGSPSLPPPTATPSPSPSPTPTATPLPLAALVNGEPIALADLEAEWQRYQAGLTAAGIEIATEERGRSQVLQALIDRKLLAQGARAAGLTVSEAELEARLEDLAAESGGPEALGAWLAANGYTLEAFRQALLEEMLAERMVAHIVAEVPETMEQVHARHILVATRQEAEALLAELQAGADFADLAVTRSLDLSTRVDGGDLGWFPPGVLTVPEVEAAAFALAPGETSGVVESRLGFHIVQTLAREERPLSPYARAVLQRRAVEAWLAEQRAAAEIETFVGP